MTLAIDVLFLQGCEPTCISWTKDVCVDISHINNKYNKTMRQLNINVYKGVNYDTTYIRIYKESIFQVPCKLFLKLKHTTNEI